MNDHATRLFGAWLLAAVAVVSCTLAAFAANPTNLRCEYRADPLGIDVENPRLNWLIESARRGELQSG
ncbi:MAG: hypothetical protein ABSH20_25060 [Tepidisphaeraceae bacterium]|jgi:alpha-L-rhamnosidase